MIKAMRFTKFQLLVHIGSLIPLGLLVYDFLTNNLTVNPIQDLTLRTGKAALVLLVLSLAATPINTLFGFREAIKVRRALGLYAFMYAGLHLLIFIGLDYGFDPGLIREAIFEKRYALAGLATFALLLPLALTSTKGWKKRLGKNWKRLHKFAYLAGGLAVVHFVWLVKSDIREPLVYGGIVALLLVMRLQGVRKWAVNTRDRIIQRIRVARRERAPKIRQEGEERAREPMP